MLQTMLYYKENTLFGQLQEHKIAYQLETPHICKNRANATKWCYMWPWALCQKWEGQENIMEIADENGDCLHIGASCQRHKSPKTRWETLGREEPQSNDACEHVGKGIQFDHVWYIIK